MPQNVSASFVFNAYLEALKDGNGFEDGDYLGIAFINLDGSRVANPYTVSYTDINTWTSAGSENDPVYNTFVIPNTTIVNHVGDVDNTYFDAVVGNSNTYSYHTPATTFSAGGFIIYKSGVALTAGNPLDSQCIPISFGMFDSIETDDFVVSFTETVSVGGSTKYIILKYTPTMTEIKQIVAQDYGMVKATSSDQSVGYLNEKLLEGDNIHISVSGEALVISSEGGASGDFIPLSGTGNTKTISGYFQALDNNLQFRVKDENENTQAMIYWSDGLHIEDYGYGTTAHNLNLNSVNNGKVEIYGANGVHINGGPAGVTLDVGSSGLEVNGSKTTMNHPVYIGQLFLRTGVTPPSYTSSYGNAIADSSNILHLTTPNDHALITEGGVVALISPSYLEDRLKAGTGINIANSGTYLEIECTGGGGGMVNPMTSAGDIIVGGTSGEPTRLEKGSDGQVLKSNSVGIVWVNDNSMTNPMTSGGQMIYGAYQTGNPIALDAPQIGQVLMGMGGSGAPMTFPQWHNSSEAVQKGLLWSSKGAIAYAGDTVPSGFLQGTRLVEYLALGTEGQYLGINSTSGIPEWKDLPETCQENFPIGESTSSYNPSANPNKLFCIRVISHYTTKRTKLGYFQRSGLSGSVMLGVYDKLGNLIGETGRQPVTSAYTEEMVWMDAITPFNVVAGEDYTFAVWFGNVTGEYSISANVLMKTTQASFDPSVIGSTSYSPGSATGLPSTLPSSLTYETESIHMAIK